MIVSPRLPSLDIVPAHAVPDAGRRLATAENAPAAALGADGMVAVTILLLLVAALAIPLAARSRLPLAAVLILLGTGLALVAPTLGAAVPHGLVGDVAAFLAAPALSPELFLHVLLPPLLFQGAVGMDVRHLVRDSAAIGLLAILAVLLSTAAIGLAVWGGLGWTDLEIGLVACLVLGALVATTDPSAVISLFRELGAPARLTRLVEAESLLNDATAIAVFNVLLGALLLGTAPSTLDLGTQLIAGLILGLILGIAGGVIAAHVIALVDTSRLAQVTLALAAPYALFTLGAQTPYVSGVVAIVACGITLGAIGRSRMERADFAFLDDLIDQTAGWASGLVFLLAALMIPRFLADTTTDHLVLIGCAVLAALGARAAILWGVGGALARAGWMRPIDSRMNAALLWGGLRGAMTLALVLAVAEAPGIDRETASTIAVVAIGITLFTLLVQGPTLRPLVHALGLTRLTPMQRALRDQTLRDAMQRTDERVRHLAKRAGFAESLVDRVLDVYTTQMEARLGGPLGADTADTAAPEHMPGLSDRDRLTLGLTALVARERTLLLEQRWSSGLPARMIDQYLTMLDAMRDDARAKGRRGYLDSAQAGWREGALVRLASRLHNSLGWQRPLARLLGRRFHGLLVQRAFVSQLGHLVDREFPRLYGARLSDILRDILAQREKAILRHLDAIRLQYPAFARALESSLIERAAHHEEAQQIRALARTGLIPESLAGGLLRDAAQLHRRLRRPGRVDIAQPRADLLRRLRAFDGFDDADLEDIAYQMRSVVYPAGRVIYRPGDRVSHITFIANGAVEVVREGEDPIRLGRGQAFGQMRVLNPDLKPARVTALSTSHCWQMSVADFRAWARKAPSWKKAMGSTTLGAAPSR